MTELVAVSRLLHCLLSTHIRQRETWHTDSCLQFKTWLELFSVSRLLHCLLSTHIRQRQTRHTDSCLQFKTWPSSSQSHASFTAWHGPWTRLGAEMFEISSMTWINHWPIATRLAQLWMCIEERTVATLQQVALRVEQCWVAITVTVSILVPQKSHPAHFTIVTIYWQHH